MFNPDTGFFARVEDEGKAEPFWSEHGPELLDISITNWCDRGCSVCYRDSNRSGRHMATSDYEMIMTQAVEIGVLQVALGGGNPNQHPEFCKILELTRFVYGIVPSYTTNGNGLSKAIVDVSAEVCGAVAVSAYPPFSQTAAAIETLTLAGVRVNLHFVLDADSVSTAIAWMKAPPPFLEKVNAVVFLNYKPVGRRTSGLLLAENPALKEFFALIQAAQFPYKVGFDSCMVSALASLTTINSSFYDACEAGRFSMFVSEALRMYPCSFMEPMSDGVPLYRKNLLDTWQNGLAFQEIRAKLRLAKCTNCWHTLTCRGGCPIFQEINLCDGAGER
jgi:radical SAM protein with 4Fe4S-binding SPASM domain